MSESNKIEKELNFKILDQEGLMTYLQTKCVFVGEYKIGFDYFHSTQDPSMYARIERHITSSGESLYLTVKRKVSGESRVEQRKEITIQVTDKKNIVALLEVLGLTYINSKGKIREKYCFEDLDIDVDSWFDENFENYVESRIEIEGEEDHNIMDFAKMINAYKE